MVPGGTEALSTLPRNNTSYGQSNRHSRQVERASADELIGYFFRADGHGAPQGAQAPAKSSGETGRPLDGEVRCSATSAAKATTNTMA
jgi:hypothetical protein